MGTLGTVFGVAVDASGNIYMAEAVNHRIRMVEKSTGIITTVVGNGSIGFSGDGERAVSATLRFPYGVAVDALGNIYIGDTLNGRVRMVTKGTGIITTIAGCDKGLLRSCRSLDSKTVAGISPTDTLLTYPVGIVVGKSGNIYISERSSILMMDKKTGIMTKSANIVSSRDYQEFNYQYLAIDPSENIYWATGDRDHQQDYRIWKKEKASGEVTVVTYNKQSSEDEEVDDDQSYIETVSYIAGLAVDTSGNIYFADASNHRIYMVAKGTNIVTTVAGNGTPDYSGDGGHVTSAVLNGPKGLAIDTSGNIYVSDAGNYRVRMFSAPTLPSAPHRSS
jgi:trimeric autotransporter adhesin